MTTIGFSTGALAFGDFRRGIELQMGYGLNAIELSALRDSELIPLVDAIPELDLTPFEYISFHAPSRIASYSETAIVQILLDRVPESWPIILHPDVVVDVTLWAELGDRLCLENMDQRKPIGRTPSELRGFFDHLPNARFCLDVAHVRQVDPTMTVAFHLIEEFGDRLAQIHVSDVNDQSRHVSLNAASIAAFRRIARFLPPCPWIIESVIPASGIEREIQKVMQSLANPALCLPRASLAE